MFAAGNLDLTKPAFNVCIHKGDKYMNLEFVERISELDDEQKTYFYELLSHFLTVSMRGILFFEGIPAEERIERAKWLNEIAHRITYKVFFLQQGRVDLLEDEIWGMINQNAEKHPKTMEDVTSAIENSYKYVIDNESDKAQVNAA